MELQKLINRAMDLRNQYEKKEKQLYGSPLTDEDIAQGFLGDVNNLVKLVKAEHGKGSNCQQHRETWIPAITLSVVGDRPGKDAQH